MKNWKEVQELERILRHILIYTPKLKRAEWKFNGDKQIERLMTKVDKLIEDITEFHADTGNVEAQFLKEMVIYMCENFRREK